MRFTPAEEEEIRRLWREGMSDRELARRFKTHHSTLSRILRPETYERGKLRRRRKWNAMEGIDPDSPRVRPSVPYVRALDGCEAATYRMVKL
jgi:IS30 family transposase